ncbi:MAG: hypothetical protein QG657_833 [Acidobacteriota bacterium]|nr:hypothetical protein [Acidobacteriota bacterium]
MSKKCHPPPRRGGPICRTVPEDSIPDTIRHAPHSGDPICRGLIYQALYRPSSWGFDESNPYDVVVFS